MPYPLCEELVGSNSEVGDLVLDPFVGSGTTIRAAAAKRRQSIGIDINPLASLIARVASQPLELDVGNYSTARSAVLDSVSDATSYPSMEWQQRIETW